MADSRSDEQTIAHLLEIMNENDLDRVKVTIGDATYELVRREPGPQAVAGGTRPDGGAAAVSGAAQTPAASASANVKKVVAPLTGVFYCSASPDAEPFVKVGDRIEAGDVVCILEAMKLFNEIQSDFGGTISRIVAENGELVTQGQDLIWIEP
jgi:acetyl-CoA carboxylase biotin carboxyl carrier protein